MPESKKSRRISTGARKRGPAPAQSGAVSAGRVVPQQNDGAIRLAMGAVVAAGCWFMAYTFTLLESPNRYLFAGMMALIALMWSISFCVRLRKWQRRR
ncbi:hypothetical protein [Dictyobacter halimunensis]|uniref:hypothetical protein n=1 Tax=Dictyobacter halimunensis TaxID=3026934 RepID=UPI0030C6B144